MDPALLLANAGATDVLLRQAALFAMARLGTREDLGKASAAAEAISAAVFSPDDSLRGTAVLAATALATHAYHRAREPLPVPDGPLTLREVLAGLGPDPYAAEARAAALVALGPALRRAAVAAVSTSPDRARVVAGLAPFTAPDEKLEPKVAASVEETVESIARAVVPGFVALERHPAVEIRTRAVEVLARRSEPDAQAAVVDALADPDESVRRAALAAVGAIRSERLTSAIAALVKDSPSWPLRVRAAEALGRIGGGDRAAAGVVETLSAAARGDSFALVREAAARAVASVDPRAARPLLEELAAKDPEPRVREAATELLAKK